MKYRFSLKQMNTPVFVMSNPWGQTVKDWNGGNVKTNVNKDFKKCNCKWH